MSNVEPLFAPPPLKRARTRKIPSGVEIIPADSAVRLRLKLDASPLDFLKAVYQCKRLPIELRIEAAREALPFVHPRLVAVMTSNASPQQIVIRGGLPALPGSNILMPANSSTPQPAITPVETPELPQHADDQALAG
jgi:hypothetical protein